jgi:hypothetical protein
MARARNLSNPLTVMRNGIGSTGTVDVEEGLGVDRAELAVVELERGRVGEVPDSLVPVLDGT